MKKLLLLILIVPFYCLAQGYTSYFTGNTNNITTVTTPGTCLMGGATENDNAMIWLLQKANGGDVVVLRTSGSNGYNNYFYSELGVAVNSVETLVITSATGATHPYVLDKVANAELIWLAGGNQWNYISYFKDNALETLLNQHVNQKNAPIGGTSAGMAVLGHNYFTAQNGTVTSAQALANPYHPNLTLGVHDFLQIPFMFNVITDTHYDNPDRRGRHTAFLARLVEDHNFQPKGIACNEYVAVCIDGNGLAKVYGEYPAFEEYAYFLMPNCESGYIENGIPACLPGQPLTWSYPTGALKVYKVPGTADGTNTFDLSDWYSGNETGGVWQHWNITNGNLDISPGTAPQDCLLRNRQFAQEHAISPNPFHGHIYITGGASYVIITDMSGRQVFHGAVPADIVDTSALQPGIYIISIEKEGKMLTKKMIKK
ncbi:hypothetical protein CHU92_09580 [Flavobacterium cyanobacteriorum]|uniref:Secretion system C-terminal sorting domain-containing protein n=1 Tax=Flavobacterium cyanobacteriorum TaxID=2022802 RepID=A0A255Z6W2_9FLAO|nr:Type 1 glutamine amidotransferase-like domain-containing protein [Flavobacterium cyanobacteriorum]OYQ36654.1 hypothetical protein CHU92_09580 [Flavobacterium cyanobacteriorum]